jgi:hypothetical protein
MRRTIWADWFQGEIERPTLAKRSRLEVPMLGRLDDSVTDCTATSNRAYRVYSMRAGWELNVNDVESIG